MLSTGVLGEYIARLFVEAKRRPIYVVEEDYEGAGAAVGETADDSPGVLSADRR